MKRENSRAEISVFFALITAMILALFLGILESARTSAARLNMTIAANSSIDSLFSQYHQGLWENYRLMGLEQYAYEQLIDEMGDFLEPYLEVKNWYPVKLEEIVLEEAIALTDGNGEVFEEDVMDYMNYGIIAELWDEFVGPLWEDDKAQEYEEEVPEGDALEEISDLYDDHSVDVAKLEKKIQEISDTVQSAEAKVSEARENLGSDHPDASDFISALNSAKNEMKKISGLVEGYTRSADKLANDLNESKAKLDAKRADIDDDLWEGLNEDIEKYSEYVTEDGEKRETIEALSPKSEENIDILDDLISQAREIEDSVADGKESWEDAKSQWEEEQSQLMEEAAQNGEEFVEESYPDFDESQYWEPLREAMSNYDPLSFTYKMGIEDKEKEQKLENLKEFLGSADILQLVLPEKPELSKEVYPDLEEMPSNNNEDVSPVSRLGILDRVRMAWYVGSFFNYFGREENFEEEPKGSERCEQEYILYGKDNDRDNVASVVTRLIALRSGLNLIYLYRDSAKRSEARAAATLIAPLPPLSIVVQFLIMTVWAAAQAVMDVRDLLSGEKVPFIHDSESFYLDVDGLYKIADSGNFSDKKSEDKNEKGLSYPDYLKILLLVGHDSSMDYRIMDMIQLAFRVREDGDGQKDFRMDRLVYSLDTTVNLRMSHIFSELGFVKEFGGVQRYYYLSIPTAYSY